ncbi:unnamed protein product [Paramecium sonneborni]|uniref:ENTH domain-containing protein n=1 Tax=Paramecium sonneborni TaxID=65129 RepID=A0A8S1P100_9CILI|nr:unnamed protein product [Paramecium sonneborni]
MQNPLQQFLTIMASREEVIFMIRILTHQCIEDGKNLKEYQFEIIRGEKKREELENQVYSIINESIHRKIFLPKVVQKFNKIQTYYSNKTKVYFPKQGQQIGQENIIQPNLRNVIISMQHEDLVSILKYLSNMQKMRMKIELNRAQYMDKEERCNRNDKFFSEPLLMGNFGMNYINKLHQKYYFLASQRNWKNVYDVLILDDNTKQLYLQGAGFKSVIASINKQKKSNDTPQVYIPIETTQEIITTRYEKLFKDLMDMNYHVSKSIIKYNEVHQRRKKNKESQNRIKITTTRHSQQVKILNLSDFAKFSAPSSRYCKTRQLKTQLSCLQSPSEPQIKQYEFLLSLRQPEASFSFKQKFAYSPEEQAIKLFDQAYHYENSILPINLLDQIAELSFQIDHYPKIINQIVLQLSTIGITANVILKTLLITDYLLKYGCSGIIDDLKVRIYMFRNYQEFKIDFQDPIYVTIRQKAGNIANQLTNRKLLYKEKEIAKQIKLKIQINKQKTQSLSNQNNKQTTTTLDDILENYLFKYMDKFNDKLESWGDQINDKLDQIIDNITINAAYERDENGYYFPDSCMDEITITNKSNETQSQQQKSNAVQEQTQNVQIIKNSQSKNLLEFEDENIIPQQQKKQEINLLD